MIARDVYKELLDIYSELSDSYDVEEPTFSHTKTSEHITAIHVNFIEKIRLDLQWDGTFDWFIYDNSSDRLLASATSSESDRGARYRGQGWKKRLLRDIRDALNRIYEDLI